MVLASVGRDPILIRSRSGVESISILIQFPLSAPEGRERPARKQARGSRRRGRPARKPIHRSPAPSRIWLETVTGFTTIGRENVRGEAGDYSDPRKASSCPRRSDCQYVIGYHSSCEKAGAWLDRLEGIIANKQRKAKELEKVSKT